jgi:hypothetical protein
VFGFWSGQVAWTDVVAGDFNRDGRADLMGRDPRAGEWWANLSYGPPDLTAFAVYRWGHWPAAEFTGVRAEPY